MVTPEDDTVIDVSCVALAMMSFIESRPVLMLRWAGYADLLPTRRYFRVADALIALGVTLLLIIEQGS